MARHGSAPFGHLLLARYEREACDAYFDIAYFITLEMIPSHVLSPPRGDLLREAFVDRVKRGQLILVEKIDFF